MEMQKIQQPIVQQILESFYLSSKQAIVSHLILFCLISKKKNIFFFHNVMISIIFFSLLKKIHSKLMNTHLT